MAEKTRGKFAFSIIWSEENARCVHIYAADGRNWRINDRTACVGVIYMYIHVYLPGVADFTLIHFYYNFIIELD